MKSKLNQTYQIAVGGLFAPLYCLGAAGLIGLASVPAGGAILTAEADTYVHNTNATTNYGTATSLQVANDGGSAIPKSKDRLAVIRFDISALTGPQSAAELALTSTTDFEFALYGIDDGGADEDFDELALTFNSFAYSGTSGDGGGDGSLISTGLTELVSGVTDASDGTSDDVLKFNSTNMLDFINNDTNGIVTFVIFHTSPQNGNYANIASREAGAGVPTLTIVPEPASVLLLAAGLACVVGRRARDQ